MRENRVESREIPVTRANVPLAGVFLVWRNCPCYGGGDQENSERRSAMPLVDRDVPGPKRNFVGYGRRPPKVFWPNNARVAVNLVVNYEEGSEYSKPAGDERNEGLAEINYSLNAKYRDLSVESVYEYGSRAGIWRLMRLFDEYAVKVTFFACAVALERNPEVGQWIKESGHEPCSHGWRWSEHWLLSREDEKQ